MPDIAIQLVSKVNNPHGNEILSPTVEGDAALHVVLVPVDPRRFVCH